MSSTDQPLVPIELDQPARNFAAQYLVDFDIARAASRAHISVSDANGLMADFRVQALIHDGRHRHTQAVNASAAMVLDRLTKIATANADEAFSVFESGEGTLSERVAALPDYVRYAIKTIEWGKGGPRVTMHDKVGALVHIGKYFSMFVDRTELSGPGGGPVPMITPTMTPEQAAAAWEDTLRG